MVFLNGQDRFFPDNRITYALVVFVTTVLVIAKPVRADPFDTALSGTANPPLCWSPRQLKGKKKESRIQTRVAGAFRKPPRGMATRPVISSHWQQALGKVIRRVDLPKGVKKIALTFDLCEQPHEISGYQGGIVDFLRQNRIRATFFSGGKWLLTHPERAQQLMADPLFQVANHAWEHRNLRLLRGKARSNEIELAQLAYTQVRSGLAQRQCLGPAGQRPALAHAPEQMSLFRFPFGACDRASMKAVGDADLLSIQWDVSAGDPVREQSASRIRRAVLGKTRPGSIIIFHANGRGWHTPEALPGIVRTLQASGYEFVTVSELLNTDGAKWVVKDSCYDHSPGDSVRYDAFSRRLHAFYKRTSARHSGRPTGRAGQKVRTRARYGHAANPVPVKKRHPRILKKKNPVFNPFQAIH